MFEKILVLDCPQMAVDFGKDLRLVVVFLLSGLTDSVRMCLTDSHAHAHAHWSKICNDHFIEGPNGFSVIHPSP